MKTVYYLRKLDVYRNNWKFLQRVIVVLVFCGFTKSACFAQQVYNISDTTISTCDAIIYDDGGPNSDYNGSNDYVMTICAANGTDLYLHFNYLVLGEEQWGNHDMLNIYEGVGTTGPQLYASFPNASAGILPPNIIASNSGCITIEMISNYTPQTDSAAGFELIVSCNVPETCSDGILNNGEIQIDCGGPNCAPCHTTTGCGELVFNGDFETADSSGSQPSCQIRSDVTSCLGWYGNTAVGDPFTGFFAPVYWNVNGCGGGNYPYQAGVVGYCNNGLGSLGFTPGISEVQSQLLAPLVGGKEYCISLDVSAWPSTNNTTTDFFIWLHNETFASGNGFYNLNLDNGNNFDIVSGPIAATPQYVHPATSLIGFECKTIRTSFCANGGEEYVVIGGQEPIIQGSFSNDYVLINNLSIKESCPLTFDSQIISSGMPDCTGSCVSLFAEVSNQAGGCEITNDFQYQWFENGVLLPGETDDTLSSVCPITTTTYSVEITYNAGCSSYTKADSLTAITFTCVPTLSTQVSAGVICEGDCATIQASLSSNSTTANYTWTESGSSSIIGLSDSLTVCPTSSTTYQVVVNDNGFIDTAFVDVVVDTSSVVAGNDTILCNNGALITLNASGASTYSWNNGVTDGQPFLPILGTTTYTVTGISSNGCVSTDQLDVTVYELPNVSAGPDQTLCDDGSLVTLSASGAVNYIWDNGVVNGQAFVPNTGLTVYTVIGTDVNGCSNMDQVNIVADGSPSADFIVSNATEITEWNPVANLINASSPEAISFQWVINNGVPLSATTENVYGVIFPADSVGSYPITLYVATAFGCQDSVTLYVNVLEEMIYYVPNTFTPDGDEFNQTFKPEFTSGIDLFDYRLVIYNRWGEVVFESFDTEFGWDGTFAGTEAMSGVYPWEITFKTSMSDERKSIMGHVNLIR